MGVFKNSKGSLCTMKVLIIKLVVWLGWLSSVAVGQLELSEAVAGFVNFPEVGISAIGNLAVLITSISKGRLDLELGARDVLATVRGPKLHEINNEAGLTTCEKNHYQKASVVMLSSSMPNSSMKQFMRYISNAHDVHSILLYAALYVAKVDDVAKCDCKDSCKCIVFKNVEGVTILLARWMPARTLKRLSDTQCLLLCRGCLTKGCHGCNQGMLYVKDDPPEGYRLMEGDSEFGKEITKHSDDTEVEFPPVFKIPVDQFVQKKQTCICIPVNRAADDKWTKLLITSFRSKDNAERGVSFMASDAMENYTAQGTKDTYLAGRGKEQLRKGLIVNFHTPSLILPRLTEILINLLLTGWFRVDGLSTAMVARKAVKSYVVGSEESGFAANAFLSTAWVMSKNSKSNDINSTDQYDPLVYQVLTFRGHFLGFRTLSFIVAAVNLLCAIFWIVFMAFEGSAGKWYDIDSVPLNMPRVAVVIVAIGIALVMDCLHLYLGRIPREPREPREPRKRVVIVWAVRKRVVIVWAVIILEIACVVSGTVAAGVRGEKMFGKCVYSAVQTLVWVKWGIGSYLLGESLSESNSAYNWKSGVLVYSSAFFLNSMLAGVRCEWKYSPSQH